MGTFTAFAVPASAVAQNGTFTAGYPTGLTAGHFANYGHKIWSEGLQRSFAQDDGLISVSFGASSATFTYKGATSLPANKGIRVEYHTEGLPTFSPLGVQIKRTVIAPMRKIDFGAPALAVSTAACASQSVTAGTAAVLNGTLAAAGVVTFDVPRNVVGAWTTTSVMTVVGTDEYGVAMKESSASGASMTGKKAFKTITSINFSISVTSFTAGNGVVLGLPVYAGYNVRVLQEFQSGVLAGSNTAKYYIQANVPLTDGTYAVSTIPIAGKVTKISAIVQGIFTTNNAVLTFKNNTTAITTGAITELVASVAAGDQYAVVPTAANSFAAGDKLMVVVSGTPGASKTTQVLVEITPDGVTNGVLVLGDQTVPSATTGDVRGTYAPTTAPDGTIYWSLLMDLPDDTYLGCTQFS